jgi:hypothetical protein
MPTIPINNIITVTMVSPMDWTERLGTTIARAFDPSIIEFTSPDANAKNITRYTTAPIVIYFDRE